MLVEVINSEKSKQLSLGVSNRISAIRCILMIMIIYCHAYNLAVYTMDDSAVSIFTVYFERIFYGWNKYCCDAFFYIISGYLLFLGYERSTIKRKLTSRIRTLVIPFLVWNTLYWLFWCTVGIVLSDKGILSDGDRYNFSIGSFFEAFFGRFPSDEPLWFLRNLIIVVALSPLLWFLIRYKFLGGVGLIAIGMICVIKGISQYNILCTILFVGLGGYFALNFRRIVERTYSVKIRILAVMIIGLNIIWTIALPMNDRFRYTIPEILFIVISIWVLTSGFEWSERCSALAGFSFFVFASHSIVLESLEKMCLILFGDKPVFALLDYCLMPVITLMTVIVIGSFIKRHVPFSWSLLNGCR